MKLGSSAFYTDPAANFLYAVEKRWERQPDKIELCFAAARIYQPQSQYQFLTWLKELLPHYRLVSNGQKSPIQAKINGVSIPWPFTAEVVLPAATPIELEEDTTRLQKDFNDALQGVTNHRLLAEVLYIMAYRHMLKGDKHYWQKWAMACQDQMRECTFKTYEDCVPIHGPMAYGVPLPNWFSPETALPRLGLSPAPSA